MASGQKWISPLTGVSKGMYTTFTSVIPEIIMLKIIIAFKYLNYLFVPAELEHIAKPLNLGLNTEKSKHSLVAHIHNNYCINYTVAKAIINRPYFVKLIPGTFSHFHHA